MGHRGETSWGGPFPAFANCVEGLGFKSVLELPFWGSSLLSSQKQRSLKGSDPQQGAEGSLFTQKSGQVSGAH